MFGNTFKNNVFCCKLESTRLTKELKAFLRSLKVCQIFPHLLVLKSMPGWYDHRCWVLLNVAIMNRNMDKYQVYMIWFTSKYKYGVLNVKSNVDVNVRNSPPREKFLYNIMYHTICTLLGNNMQLKALMINTHTPVCGFNQW